MTGKLYECRAQGAQPAGGAQAQPVQTRPDPYLYPPPDAIFFDRFASVSVAAGATALLAEIRLGSDELAMLTGIGQEILDDPAGTALTGFSNTSWSLQINKVRTRDFGSIVDQVGRGDDPTTIQLKVTEAGALIQFYVTNSHATDAFLCFGRIQGYSFRRIY